MIILHTLLSSTNVSGSEIIEIGDIAYYNVAE
jgi:hypothetical protein